MEGTLSFTKMCWKIGGGWLHFERVSEKAAKLSTYTWNFGLNLNKNAKKTNYRKVGSSNMSCLEAHTGFFLLLMKGIFGPYLLWMFDKELIS